MRGCPYGAYFSSNSSTLPAADATGNMTLMPNSIVHEIIYDEDKKKAKGVRVIDSENNQIFVDLSDDEIKNRIKNWSKPDLKIKKGILYKYVKSVSNASNGCVTDE